MGPHQPVMTSYSAQCRNRNRCLPIVAESHASALSRMRSISAIRSDPCQPGNCITKGRADRSQEVHRRLCLVHRSASHTILVATVQCGIFHACLYIFFDFGTKKQYKGNPRNRVLLCSMCASAEKNRKRNGGGIEGGIGGGSGGGGRGRVSGEWMGDARMGPVKSMGEMDG